MDTIEGVTFELRRRLTEIVAECDVLLEGDEELSPDVRESIGRIDDRTRELTTLIARLETAEVSGQTLRPIEGIEPADETSASTLSVDTPVLLALDDDSFVRSIVAELERDRRNVILEPNPRTAATRYRDRTSDTPQPRLVADVVSWLDRSDSGDEPVPDALMSLVTPPDVADPILGASGLLAPDATADTVTTVVDTFHDPDVPTEPLAVVNLETDVAGLDTLDRTVYQLTRDDAVPPDAGCVFVPAESTTESLLARLRKPHDGRRPAVVVVGTPPRGTWTSTVGGRTFVQRPPTAADLVGELLLVIDES